MITIVRGSMFLNIYNNAQLPPFIITISSMSVVHNTSLHTQTINPFMTPLIPNNVHGNPYMPRHGSTTTLLRIPFQAPYVPSKLHTCLFKLYIYPFKHYTCLLITNMQRNMQWEEVLSRILGRYLKLRHPKHFQIAYTKNL